MVRDGRALADLDLSKKLTPKQEADAVPDRYESEDERVENDGSHPGAHRQRQRVEHEYRAGEDDE